MKFTDKLNKIEGKTYTVEEEIVVTNGDRKWYERNKVGGTWLEWQEVSRGGTSGNYLPLTGGQMQGHLHVAPTQNHIPNGSSTFEVISVDPNSSAYMSFHVPGNFACFLGVSATTRKLSVGGWSMGTNEYEIYHAGNRPTAFTWAELRGY